jgi:tetracycline resistance efflux pump
MEYGILSLLPPLMAIALAIKTKQVYLSLMAGIWLGWMIISDWNILDGTLASIQALVDVFKDAGNTRTIMFGALVGALILFIQRSGGVEGFVIFVQKTLSKLEQKRPGKNRQTILFFTWMTGLLIFVESSISVLTVGALYRPLFDKYKISREKLAYLADSSSAPSCILIPFNAWGAFIMGLLAAEGFTDPFAILIKTIPYNFYAIFALAIPLFLIWKDIDFGPMKKAEARIRTTGQILPDGAQPMVSEELTDVAPKPGIPPKAVNMLLPIAVMILMMPIMLAYTGWPEALAQKGTESFFVKALFAIGQGSGSTAVLIAVISSLLIASVFYKVQGIFSLKEIMDLTLKGISGLMPLALLMLFAFAISTVCKELQTGQYVAGVASNWLSPALVPFLIFVVSCFISFSTGTSWGTFAIMIAIAVPMAREMEAPMLITIAAALSGGVFGDHCSPISDTTILSSMASACDHIDHVQTQMPYALVAGGIAALMYLVAGFMA